jgi:ketosteroid isomerase-like protein
MSPVRQFLLDLHDCWPRGDLQQLARFYHPDVVLLPPDLGPPICGRDAVVASYREFLDASTLETFTVESLEIFPFEAQDGGVYMAHLTFDITYELGGRRYAEKGLEVYTVREQAGELQVLWRNQMVLEAAPGPASGKPG